MQKMQNLISLNKCWFFTLEAGIFVAMVTVNETPRICTKMGQLTLRLFGLIT